MNKAEFNIAPVNDNSHVMGRTDAPLLDYTIPALLKETVRRFPNHDAAVFCEQSIRWSYSEFDFQVDDANPQVVQNLKNPHPKSPSPHSVPPSQDQNVSYDRMKSRTTYL